VRWPRRSPWLLASAWVATLRMGLESLTRLIEVDIPQPYENIWLFEIDQGDQRLMLAIDYADSHEISAECAQSVALYFKFQFADGGYGCESVVPGGYVVRKKDIYEYLGRLRRIRDHSSPLFDVYGRFGNYGQPIRREAIRQLQEQRQFAYEGALRTVVYSQSLYEAARSRVCVDLPGRGDFCFRLMDYLSIGSCVVALRHRTRLPVPLVDGEHIAYCDSPSELVELCTRYLEDESERRRLCRNSRELFDRSLHPRQLASYYLSTVFSRPRLGNG
jgi:hypothetical protein